MEAGQKDFRVYFAYVFPPPFFFIINKATPQRNHTRYLTQLLTLPFTLYEQSLLYSRFMHSSTVLPCPVLIHKPFLSSETLCTNDTSRRMCSSYSTTGDAARARERKVLMGDVLAVMLRAECAIVGKDWAEICMRTRSGLKGRCLGNFSLHPRSSIPMSTGIQHFHVCIHVHVQA